MLKIDHMISLLDSASDFEQFFEHFIELYLEVCFVWTWRNGDGFWQCHFFASACYWFGHAITSLFGARRFELEFSIRLFVKYFRGWVITSCESIRGVADAVVKSENMDLKMHKNMMSYETIISCQLIYGQVIIYLCDK